MRKRFIYLFIIIIFIAALPRAIELLSGNYLFGYDQGVFFNAVKKIVIDHKIALIGTEVGGQGGFFQGPGWYYLLSIPFLFTKGDPYGAMVLMFLLGIGTIIFTALFAKKMFGINTAILITFLVGISPAIITQSRSIWPPYPISFLTVFFIFFIHKFFSGEKKFLPLATFTIGLMAHFEMAVAGTLLLQCIIFSPIFFLRKLLTIRLVFLSILSFLSTLTTLFIFDMRHDFIITKGVLQLGGAPVLNPEHKVTFYYVQLMLKNHFDAFFYNFISTFQKGNTFLLPILFTLVIGSVVYIKDKAKPWAQKMLVFYLVTNGLCPPLQWWVGRVQDGGVSNW